MSLSPAEYQRRRAAHECVRCRTKTNGHALCVGCRSSDVAKQTAKRAAYDAAGLCTLCGGPRDCEKKLCKECRDIRAIKERMNYVPVEVDHRTAGLTKRWPSPPLGGWRGAQAIRREANVAAGICINETTAGTHGIATHGVLCRRCRAVHRFGAVIVAERGVDALIPPNPSVIADAHDQRNAA